MRTTGWALAMAVALFASCQTSPAPHARQKEMSVLEAYDLRCQYRSDPMGIDAPAPLLSWKLHANDPEARGLKQTAYRILAASEPGLLGEGRGDLWDSGRVDSARQLGIPYEGQLLESGQHVWWQVRVWAEGNPECGVSETAEWEMGLLTPDDWEGGWIRGTRDMPEDPNDLFGERPAPLLRTGFTADKPVRRARLYVSGLGYYEARLNGRRVGDHELDPGWTPYATRVFYSTYDVTDRIAQGENALGAVLGNGWFNPLPLQMWNRINPREHLRIGVPRVIMQLNVEYLDGSTTSVHTSPDWRTADSPILNDSVYLGETYDARREQAGWDLPGFDDHGWANARAAEKPVGPLRAQPIPPIRVTETLRAVSVHKVDASLRREDQHAPGEAAYVFDFGQNIAGRARLSVEGPAGATVRLRYGELLYPDGTLNPMTAVCGQIKDKARPEGSLAPETAWQRDFYTLKGEGRETYAPRFTFHGFRYVEVTGFPGKPETAALVAERLHTDVQPAGAFECSNPLFNQIQEVSVQALLGNLHGVQSDCPHREKFGYGGDIVACSEMALFNCDMAALYRKIAQDFLDEVRPNGGFTETAPFVGIYDEGLGEKSGPIGWGTVHPLLMRQLHQYYGEERMLREHYGADVRWAALLHDRGKRGVLQNGIGDHESIAPKDTRVTGTAFYYYNLKTIAELARILGYDADARSFGRDARQIARTFADALIGEDGAVGNGSQANQACALYHGLAPEDDMPGVTRKLRDALEEAEWHLSTGIFGTKYLLPVLCEHLGAEQACRVVDQRDFPSWGYMLENGATTLWEHWAFSDNTFSHNHPMFGSVSEWFFKYLAGIRPEPDAVGFDAFVLAPELKCGLEWVRASHDSVRGLIRSEWRREGGTVTLELGVPVNTQATLVLPPGMTLRDAEDAEALDTIAGRTRYRLGSGDYAFVAVEAGAQRAARNMAGHPAKRETEVD